MNLFKTSLLFTVLISNSAFAFTYQCRNLKQTQIVNVTVGDKAGQSSMEVMDENFNVIETRSHLDYIQSTDTTTQPATRRYVLSRRIVGGGISGMKPAIILTIEAGTRKGTALFEGKKLACQMMVTRD